MAINNTPRRRCRCKNCDGNPAGGTSLILWRLNDKGEIGEWLCNKCIELIDRVDGAIIYVHSPKCPNRCEYACNGRLGTELATQVYGRIAKDGRSSVFYHTPMKKEAAAVYIAYPADKLVTEHLYGEGAIRIPAKMVFTGSDCRGFVGVIAFESPVKDKNVTEMWEGDLVFIPRRKAQCSGVPGAVGHWRADQIMTSGFKRTDWAEPYWLAPTNPA